MVADWVVDAVEDGSEDEIPDAVLAEMDQDDTPPGEVESLRAESIAIIRDLLIKAHPDVLPELVTGETLADLLESVTSAEAIFARVAEVIDARRAETKPPAVPAGADSPGGCRRSLRRWPDPDCAQDTGRLSFQFPVTRFPFPVPRFPFPVSRFREDGGGHLRGCQRPRSAPLPSCLFPPPHSLPATHYPLPRRLTTHGVDQD